MGDGAEGRPPLDAWWVNKYLVEISKTGTRRELDQVTRRIWKMWNTPPNAAPLRAIQTAIETRREVLKRNNPR